MRKDYATIMMKNLARVTSAKVVSFN